MDDDQIAELAKAWQANHQPFYAIDGIYGIAAFTAGYKAALESFVKDLFIGEEK